MGESGMVRRMTKRTSPKGYFILHLLGLGEVGSVVFLRRTLLMVRSVSQPRSAQREIKVTLVPLIGRSGIKHCYSETPPLVSSSKEPLWRGSSLCSISRHPLARSGEITICSEAKPNPLSLRYVSAHPGALASSPECAIRICATATTDGEGDTGRTRALDRGVCFQK